MTERKALRILAGLVILAAALRLWRIGHQSYWLDEVFTVGLVNEDLVGMLEGVRETESTPHLYYVLAWLWEKPFGDGEGALRSLSALIGIATVPLAYAAARELFAPATAVLAAALVAVNPWFVWYSQEARAYALLVLLITASLLFLARARREPSARNVALWAVVAALAVLTHYFAAFTVGAEALWLVWATRERAAVWAAGALVVLGLALAPLALSQRESGHTKFIEETSLGTRATDIPKRFVTGELGTPTPALGPLAGLLVLGAAALVLWRVRRRERERALWLGALAAVTVAVPLALAVLGFDYLLPRNVVAAFVPAAIALAAGFAAHRWGPFLAAALCAIAVAVSIQVSFNDSLQRDDWRGLVRALGPKPRLVVLSPSVQLKPLEHYGGDVIPLPAGGYTVREVDAIFIARRSIEREPEPPEPGWRVIERRTEPSWTLVRFAAPGPGGVGHPGGQGASLTDEPPYLGVQR